MVRKFRARLMEWVRARHPELVTAYTLCQALKAIKQTPALERQHPLFIFSILIGWNTAYPLIIDCTPHGLDRDAAVTLDAWWSEECKDLVQPIVDKINLVGKE